MASSNTPAKSAPTKRVLLYVHASFAILSLILLWFSWGQFESTLLLNRQRSAVVATKEASFSAIAPDFSYTVQLDNGRKLLVEYTNTNVAVGEKVVVYTNTQETKARFSQGFWIFLTEGKREGQVLGMWLLFVLGFWILSIISMLPRLHRRKSQP